MINLERAQEIAFYNPLSGDFICRKKGRGYNCGAVMGYKRKDGYIRLKINGNLILVHRLAWAFVYGIFPTATEQIDHINRNRSDNSIDNLRIVNQSKNLHNSGPYKNSSTKVRGVYWDNNSEKWRASIQVHKQRINLGSYSKFKDAVKAVETFREEHKNDFFE